ncbi:hypothetical protein LZ31DRAFT_298662 [Colletotrichum somersetense]|nr:hypothetical protein LZ31DRAFT_298662 [Colletotrichum somersetense]
MSIQFNRLPTALPGDCFNTGRDMTRLGCQHRHMQFFRSRLSGLWQDFRYQPAAFVCLEPRQSLMVLIVSVELYKPKMTPDKGIAEYQNCTWPSSESLRKSSLPASKHNSGPRLTADVVEEMTRNGRSQTGMLGALGFGMNSYEAPSTNYG